MIPGTYDIEIYQGDSYYGPLITLPSLVPFGGPADLTSATVTAFIQGLVDFTVDVEDEVERELRLTLTPAQTAALPAAEMRWKLEVSLGGWIGTPLAGSATITGEPEEPEEPGP